MTRSISRRVFLRHTSLGAVGLGAWTALRLRGAPGANERVRVAIIGCNGRGMDHIAGYLGVGNVEIAYVCDVDSRAVEKGVSAAAKRQLSKPKAARDLRRVLDDPNVDAVSIATPDHWHTPAAILACTAGKHVYVEKPGSHDLQESKLVVAAAQKHRRLVQMGNQRRSWPWIQETMDMIHRGELGRVYYARSWYSNHRPPIGHGKPAEIPSWLDWSLWQGPAPEEHFRDNLLHYNWHWFWTWGTGELGNNGVHALDLARWGLQVEAPLRVTCGGNRYHYQDDWETPDTCSATFDFGDKGILWQGQSCDPRGIEGSSFGVSFHGDHGTVVIAGDVSRIYDLNNKLMREIPGTGDDVVHFANFVEAIRNGQKLRAEIVEGQKSTRLCHLGNIAWRSGRTVNFDPKTLGIIGDKQAARYAARTYRHGWEPKV